MSFRPRLATGSRILLAVLMVSLLPPVAAKPGASSKLKTLAAKKKAAHLQRKQAERKLRQVKQEQEEVTGDLRESGRRLASTEAGVRRTQARLRWTQNSLDQARAKLAAINTQLDQQTDLLWKRIELFYKQGSVGYVEVVLGASDFDQFVDRTVLVRSIAEEDLRLKQGIENNKHQQEALNREIARKVKSLQSLKADYQEQAQDLRVQQSRQEKLLASVKTERAKQEAAYQAIVDTERQIEKMLWRLNGGPGRAGGPVRHLAGGFILPCNGRLTSPFGWRIHPVLGTRRFHDGQDIAAPSGTTIRAAAAGTVVHAGWLGAYGNAVMVDHGGGYTTMYGHCSSLLVGVGQKVTQGQPIARVGSTGLSTGAHCHFSVYVNGVAVNPLAVR